MQEQQYEYRSETHTTASVDESAGLEELSGVAAFVRMKVVVSVRLQTSVTDMLIILGLRLGRRCTVFRQM